MSGAGETQRPPLIRPAEVGDGLHVSPEDLRDPADESPQGGPQVEAGLAGDEGQPGQGGVPGQAPHWAGLDQQGGLALQRVMGVETFHCRKLYQASVVRALVTETDAEDLDKELQSHIYILRLHTVFLHV